MKQIQRTSIWVSVWTIIVILYGTRCTWPHVQALVSASVNGKIISHAASMLLAVTTPTTLIAFVVVLIVVISCIECFVRVESTRLILLSGVLGIWCIFLGSLMYVSFAPIVMRSLSGP